MSAAAAPPTPATSAPAEGKKQAKSRGAPGAAHAAKPSLPEVVKVTVERHAITDPEVLKVNQRIFGAHVKIPLASASITIELRNCPPEYANALRRCMIEEVPGCALEMTDFSGTTDPFIISEQLGHVLNYVPLRYGLSRSLRENLTLSIRAYNDTEKTKAVYAGDMIPEFSGRDKKESLSIPIFNPTTIISLLQPKKLLQVQGIRITEGLGRHNAKWNVGHSGAIRALDVPQEPRSATHDFDATEIKDTDGGFHPSDCSGFKTSSLLATPRHHEVFMELAAVSDRDGGRQECLSLALAASKSISDRLQNILNVFAEEPPAVGGPAGSGSGRGPEGSSVDLVVVPKTEQVSEAMLRVKGESFTVGELMRRSIFETDPTVTALGVEVKNDMLTINVRSSSDVTRLLHRAALNAASVFKHITSELEKQ